MSLGVQQHVVGLDVPVDVPKPVDGVDGQHHLHDVELGHVFREAVLEFAQQGEKVAAAVVVHHQVLQNKRMIHVVGKEKL